tara:strand:+ start:423 stop:620 length:198 start_codon:yes stop_codon:yes gene_type:complete
MNKNEWLVSWSTKERGDGALPKRDFSDAQECQYINDVVLLIQKEVLSLKDLYEVKIKPINRGVQT